MSTRPQYATVANAPAGSVADNTAIVQVGDAGQISFYNGSGGSAVDVRADVEGYVTSNGLDRGRRRVRAADAEPDHRHECRHGRPFDAAHQ